MNRKSENGLYFIDDNYRILYMNDAVRKMYPGAGEGQYCYSVIAGRQEACADCPALETGKIKTLFNPKLRMWQSVQSAEADIPGIGRCRSVTFSPAGYKTDIPDTAEKDEKEAPEGSPVTGMICRYCGEGMPLYYASRRMTEALGYESYEELFDAADGMFINIVHPDDRDLLSAYENDRCAAGAEISAVYRMRKKDGSWMWCTDSGNTSVSDNGRTAAVSVCTDIAGALGLRKELEKQNRLLMEQKGFIRSADDGEKEKAEAALRAAAEEKNAEELRSLEKENSGLRSELEAKTAAEEKSADELRALEEKNSELLSALEAKTAAEEKSAEELRSLEKENNELRSALEAKTENKDELSALEEENSALKNALEKEQGKVQQSGEIQQSMLDSVSCGIFAYTVPEMKLIAVNSAARRMIDCDEDEDPISELNQFLSSRVVPDDRERVNSAKNMLREPGDTLVQEYRAVVKGKLIFIHSNIKLLESSDGERYVLVTMLDNTELETRNSKLNNVLSMQHQMTDFLGSGIFAYTVPEYETLILNQEAKKMFDYVNKDPEKFGAYITGLIIPEDREAVRQAAKKLVYPGDSVEYLFRADVGENGRSVFKCHTKLLSFGDGQMYIISSVTDITEQALTARRLDEERRHYRSALAYGSEAIFTIDLTKDSIEESVVSPGGASLTEKLGLQSPLSYDELAKRWFSDERIISGSRDIDAVRSREAIISMYNSGTSVFDLEYHLRDEARYYHVLVLLYEINESLQASFVIYDITSDKQDERLRKSVIDSLGQIYSSLYYYSLADDRFIIFKAEPDMEDNIHENMTYGQFREFYAEHYVLPEFRNEVYEKLAPENLREMLSDCASAAFEYKRKNTGWYSTEFVAAERKGGGEVSAVVFAGCVTEKQKQAEFAQQEALKAAYEAANLANDAKTKFLTAMSHDVRTPLNAIIGMTAIAGTHIGDRERVADCLTKIDMSSKHLLGLINEVLDMSKIESGKMELAESAFSMPDLISSLMAITKPEIAMKKHSLCASVLNITHEEVIGDSQRIQQVLINLISNAVKYTPDGGKIRFSLTEEPSGDPARGCYVFTVSDNGIGIESSFMDQVFEPFARAVDDPRVSNVQGTGLGMPIARNIVRMMDGDITVKSVPGEGTEFTVKIYLRLNGAAAPSGGDFSGISVLVSDTEKETGEYLCRMLESIGISGELVTSGQDAVETTVRHYEEGDRFSAVILDWDMPDMNGAAASDSIRRIMGKYAPVIIISSFDCAEIESAAMNAGASAFINKPVFMSGLVRLFGRLTGRNKTESQPAVPTVSSDERLSGRVLLAEDVELNAEIALEILRAAGIEVDLAVNGSEAVDKFKSVPEGYYDLILMDIQMPVMNGYEAARAIRSVPGDYAASVPIIAMTANAFAEDIAAAERAGMNGHVSKPIEIQQLHAVLKKWLKYWS